MSVNFKSSLLLSAFVVLSFSAFAQNAPNPLPAPPPAPMDQPQDRAVTKKESQDINAAIVAARAASKEKRYADSEALMLNATKSNPNLILPWVELGLAQIGLKKYDDAENSFKIALGIDPASVRRAHSQDFYQQADAPGEVAPSATRASRNTAGGGVADSGEKRTPDILGASYASLGEIYIHQGKTAGAQAAFDTAVKSFPADAALYRRNETIFFFQAGNSEAQLAAANQAIAIDPGRAMLYYFRGQALVSSATVDPKTQKMILPPGCAEAYQKYLDLDFNGPYSADAKSILTAAGVPIKAAKK
jgi:tetratricopeptide (TPR) repeat protein